MVFYGVNNTETILVHEEHDEDIVHYVEMERDCDSETFYVRTCCSLAWEWEFVDNASNYEMVKHAIIDTVLDCDDMDEAMRELDEIFEEVFKDIVACECEVDCNHYQCK